MKPSRHDLRRTVRNLRAMRFTAFAVMFSVLLLPLASALHFALVAHHYCAMHGVIEHESAQDSNPGAPDGTRSDVPAPDHGDRAPADKHESCSHPIHLPALEETPPPPLVATAVFTAPSSPRVDRVVDPVVAILRLAPKTPPPHLA